MILEKGGVITINSDVLTVQEEFNKELLLIKEKITKQAEAMESLKATLTSKLDTLLKEKNNGKLPKLKQGEWDYDIHKASQSKIKT